VPSITSSSPSFRRFFGPKVMVFVDLFPDSAEVNDRKNNCGGARSRKARQF